MAKKNVEIDHFLIFFAKTFSVKMMFLHFFLKCSHHERTHFDLAVLLRRWCSLRSNLRTVREVRHVCYFEVCSPASCMFILTNCKTHMCSRLDNSRTRVQGGRDGFLGRPQPGSGFCEVFVSVFFLSPMMCVTKGIRFWIWRRSSCWLCYV